MSIDGAMDGDGRRDTGSDKSWWTEGEMLIAGVRMTLGVTWRRGGGEEEPSNDLPPPPPPREPIMRDYGSATRLELTEQHWL